MRMMMRGKKGESKIGMKKERKKWKGNEIGKRRV